MLNTVYGLVNLYFSNFLDVLLHDEVRQQSRSNRGVLILNLMEIALRQLFHVNQKLETYYV